MLNDVVRRTDQDLDDIFHLDPLYFETGIFAQDLVVQVISMKHMLDHSDHPAIRSIRTCVAQILPRKQMLFIDRSIHPTTRLIRTCKPDLLAPRGDVSSTSKRLRTGIAP